MTRSNTVATPPAASLLKGEVRGFCRNKSDKAALLAFGLTEKQIYSRGEGAQDIGPCLATYRRRPGVIVLAEDMRAFGDSKREVAAQITGLEKAGIRILDLSNPDHQTYAEHLQFAQMKISGSRFHDRRRAKRIGQHGGTAKGAAMQARRNARVADDIVERLCSGECPLSWKLRAWVLGDGFSATSLFRQHGKR